MTHGGACHTGQFEYVDPESGELCKTRFIWIDICTDSGAYGDFYVYADAENTLNWLEERGLLKFDVLPDNGYNG